MKSKPNGVSSVTPTRQPVQPPRRQKPMPEAPKPKPIDVRELVEVEVDEAEDPFLD